MTCYACALILLYLVITGSAQPMYGRPHPLYGRQQEADNFLAAAILLGLDFGEMPILQQPAGPRQRGGGQFNNVLRNLGLALGFGPTMGMPTRPFTRQRAMQDLSALSMLGLIDGPDVPDGPARRPGGRGKAGRRGQGAKRAGRRGGGAAAEGAEAAPAKGPGKRRQRRKRPAKKAQATKK